MSNRLLVLISGLLLLSALVSYVYYRRVVASVPVDLWALVPDDAAVVLATRDHPTLVRRLKETQLWDNLASLRYFQQVEEQVVLADSLGDTKNSVLGFLGRKRVLTSLHVTGPHTFDMLLLVPVASVREHRQLRTLAEALGRDPRYQVSTRDYEGLPLTTIRQRRTGGSVSYANYRNTLIISANAGLIETVLRRTQLAEPASILSGFSETDYLKLKDVDGAVLLNYRQLPPFLGVFFRPELRPEFEYLASIGDKGLLEMKVNSNRVFLNGFSRAEAAGQSLHQRLRGQPAGQLHMAEVLSTRTAVLVHLATDPAALRVPMPADTLAHALVDSLATTLGDEVALCYLAAPSPRVVPGRLALVHTRDAAATARWLGQLRRATGTSPAFERVGGYQLYQHGVPRLSSRLLGPLFAQSSQTAVGGATALVGNYLVLADDPAALRLYLTDLAAGSSWGRTPTQVALLEETTPVARLSLLLDTRNCWNALLRGLVEERRAGLLRNEGLFQRFPQVALQFAPSDGGQYYTQLVLRHPPVGPAVAGSSTAGGAGSTLRFEAGLAALAPVLLPAAGGSAPLVVQDRRGAVHYVSPDNTVEWSDSLGTPLLAPPALLPGAFRQRPGLLLLTAGRIHLLTERGTAARNFPLNLPDTVQAASLSFAPAADGLPPRLLVADRYANLYLYDTQGRAPAAWQPKRLDAPLAAPPQLLHIGGRDVVVCLQANGYIYAFDALGSTLPGFPISLGARLRSGAVVEVGTTLRRTRLSVVNQHAELVTFTLGGDVVQRRRLTTWSRLSTFRLVPDQQARSFVVVRDDGQGLLSVYDPAGRRLLEHRFLTSADKPVQLYDFGQGRRVVVVTETGPGKAYLFDAQGRLVGGQPFDSSAPGVALSYDAPTDTYQLYRVAGTELRRLTLKLN